MISAALADEIEEKCGPLVKWLRQRPLTPLTSVRIRYGSPFFLLTESGKVNIMFVAANAVAIVGAY